MSIPDGAEYWWDIRGYSSCYEGGNARQHRPPGPPNHAKGSIHLHANESFSKKRMLSLCGQPFRPTRLRHTPTSEKLNDGALCLACSKLYELRDNTKICVVQSAQLKFTGGVDVSRKTGDVVFAPSWSILQPAIELRRNGKETDETWQRYIDAYTSEMRVSWQRHRAHWIELISERSIVVKCYCMKQHLPRCHRVVLGGLLEQVGRHVGIDVFYTGEIAS